MEEIASGAEASLQGKTFALTFRSKLNETFTTIPIVFKADDLPDFVNDIQLALLNLPNRVIDGITVAASNRDDVDHNGLITVNVTFTGEGVQGPQNMILVED